MKYILVLALILAGCSDENKSSDQLANSQQESLSKQSVQSVGLPSIVNFQEKRILKMIFELRDSAKLPTFTYIVDLNGNLHKLCSSIGYGIPYATQYTSPQKVSGGIGTPSTGNVAVPQADPNGLFSPASADGTWVLCLDPKSKELSPVYIEPRIIVSQFEL